MDVEICIHGKPLAHETYSTAAEQANDIINFCNSFFENRSDYQEQSLVAETKIWQNRIYSYYTYNRNNIKDLSGRTAYFAITLRTDAFVKNLYVIYNVLDIVYNQFVIGTILSKEKDTKYAIENFEKIGKEICDIILNLLSQVIQTKDLVRLDDTFLANSGVPLSFNPCDNRCLDLLSEYKKAEKIIISPSSSLLRELQKAKEYQQKLEYIKKETEERYISHLRKMQAENQELQKEREEALSNLKMHIERCKAIENKVCDLEQKLLESERKNKNLSDRANLKTELVKISDPLMRLNTLLQRIGIASSSLQNSQPSIRRLDVDFEKKRPEKVSSYKNSNIWKFALILFALASILLLVVLFFQIKLYSKYNNSYVEEPKVENVQVGDIKEKEGQTLTKIEDLKEFEQKKDELEDARIDIQGQNTYPDGLVAETRYPIGLVNKEGNYVDSLIDIKWDCRGGYINPKHGNKVSLRTKQSGTIQILCFLPNGQTITCELKVYEKKTNQHSSSSIRKDSKITIPNPPSSISGKERSKSSDL